MNFKDFLSRWLPVFFWCGLIFYLSSLPSTKVSQNPLLDEIFHYGAHLVEYAIFYFWLDRALRIRKGYFSWLPFLLLIGYAFSDELHQLFVPTRTADLKDILMDLIGGLTAWKLLLVIRRQKLNN